MVNTGVITATKSPLSISLQFKVPVTDVVVVVAGIISVCLVIESILSFANLKIKNKVAAIITE